jgi:glycosyltransferase involved in cell wall biosynthesis
MKVTIIIPTYNRSGLISNTLRSIQNQSFDDWECLIVDDHSTDNTAQIIDSFSEIDCRFKYMKNTNKKGACGARNTGLNASKGEYIVFFDSDDIMARDHLKYKIDIFLTKPTIDVVTSFTHVLNKDGEIIDVFTWQTHGLIFQNLIKGLTYVDTNSAMIRKSKINDIRWDECLVSYQEWDFHLALSKAGLMYYQSWEFLTSYYRRGEDTISSDTKNDAKGRLYIYLKWYDYFSNELGPNRFFDRILGIKNWEIIILELSPLFISNTETINVLLFQLKLYKYKKKFRLIY